MQPQAPAFPMAPSQVTLDRVCVVGANGQVPPICSRGAATAQDTQAVYALPQGTVKTVAPSSLNAAESENFRTLLLTFCLAVTMVFSLWQQHTLSKLSAANVGGAECLRAERVPLEPLEGGA